MTLAATNISEQRPHLRLTRGHNLGASVGASSGSLSLTVGDIWNRRSTFGCHVVVLTA